MSEFLKRVLSRDSGAFWQVVKYGAIGVFATALHTFVFYVCAATVLPCLKADDFAVRFLGLPAADVADAVRAWRFTAATAVGFVAANLPCWLLNRAFVFKAGRFPWYVEFAMFIAVSGIAVVLATATSAFLIHRFGMMTSLAVAVEVVVSFLFNYFIRKFVIFRG